MIEVEIPITLPPSAYGDGGYSSNGWAGIVDASAFVQGYTVWGIDTAARTWAPAWTAWTPAASPP